MSGILNKLGSVSGILGTTVAAGVPSDVVAYRASGTSTPTGFSEYTSVRGRMIVGLQSGGADAGTVGTALTTAQDKTHTHTGPSHRHHVNIVDVPDGGYDRLGVVAGYLADTGTNSAGQYVPDGVWGGYSGTNYGYKYSDYQGTGATGTGSTSDVLAYIQLMTIKKD